MNFVKFAVCLICFGFLFWHVLILVIFLPTMGVAPLLVWTTKGERTTAKRVLFLPVLLVTFLFGTFLPAAFYSGGVFAITSHFMQHATHTWVYVVIGGLLCFWFAAPSGETSLLAVLSSLGCYILFMTVMGSTGQRIGDIGDTIIIWAVRIMLVLLVIGLLAAAVQTVRQWWYRRSGREAAEAAANAAAAEERDAEARRRIAEHLRRLRRDQP